MTYRTLDLQELAAEFEALEEQGVTCGTCKGEGVIEANAEHVADGAAGDLYEEIPCAECDGDGEIVPEDKSDLPEDDFERWQQLKELDDEVGGLSYLADNEGHAISDDDFAEYAEQLAEDIGAVSSDHQWPLYCIDWERAANDLRSDYSVFSFEGTDWLVRA